LTRRGRPDDDARRLAAVAATVHRLAVLLSAGVPPDAAWRYLAEGGDPAASVVVARCAAGERLADAIAAVGSEEPAGPWRALAAAWRVAAASGAPLAATLTEFAGSLRALAQTRREIRIALAGPRATVKLVLALPPVGVLFGAALGFDTLGVLFGSTLGLACLAAGAVLLGIALRWNRRLVAAAARGPISPGLGLDLVAVALGGGGALDRAVAEVEQVLAELGLDPVPPDALAGVLGLSRRAGVPAAALLRSEAEQERREAAASAAERAAALGVRLMLPLGVCVLPAFVAVAVLPLLYSVVSSTVELG
jgi:tight adherence protein B